MKRRIPTLTSFLLCVALSISITATSQTQSSNKSETTKEVIVPISKLPGFKQHLMPARKLSMTLSISNDCIYFSVPLQNYPLYVELEKTAPESRVWTSTLFQPEDCLENFDGSAGSYHITITDPEASEYTGDFYL